MLFFTAKRKTGSFPYLLNLEACLFCCSSQTTEVRKCFISVWHFLHFPIPQSSFNLWLHSFHSANIHNHGHLFYNFWQTFFTVLSKGTVELTHTDKWSRQPHFLWPKKIPGVRSGAGIKLWRTTSTMMPLVNKHFQTCKLNYDYSNWQSVWSSVKKKVSSACNHHHLFLGVAAIHLI